jgi:hypothetical protein
MMKQKFIIICLTVCSLPGLSQSSPAANVPLKKSEMVQLKSNNATQLSAHTESLDTSKKKILVGHQNISFPADRSNAQLLDVTGQISSDGDSFDNSWGKDADTHWSFGLFDHNDRPVASFHDDSDNDQYNDADVITVKMHLDNPATLKDFMPIGRIHVNIAPNGHDTWHFKQLKLTFDFTNPNFSLQVALAPGVLSQDHRDVDLIFAYDGQNFQAR